jgi:hypothetical protein
MAILLHLWPTRSEAPDAATQELNMSSKAIFICDGLASKMAVAFSASRAWRMKVGTFVERAEDGAGPMARSFARGPIIC